MKTVKNRNYLSYFKKDSDLEEELPRQSCELLHSFLFFFNHNIGHEPPFLVLLYSSVLIPEKWEIVTHHAFLYKGLHSTKFYSEETHLN